MSVAHDCGKLFNVKVHVLLHAIFCADFICACKNDACTCVKDVGRKKFLFHYLMWANCSISSQTLPYNNVFFPNCIFVTIQPSSCAIYDVIVTKLLASIIHGFQCNIEHCIVFKISFSRLDFPQMCIKSKVFIFTLLRMLQVQVHVTFSVHISHCGLCCIFYMYEPKQI